MNLHSADWKGNLRGMYFCVTIHKDKQPERDACTTFRRGTAPINADSKQRGKSCFGVPKCAEGFLSKNFVLSA
jgi:hypothetical protein